jgi:hypothetical protein
MIEGDKELAAQGDKSKSREHSDKPDIEGQREHPKPGTSVKDTLKGIPYQRAGQIRQALNERRNARSQGNHERVKAADKHLDALDYTGDLETETTDDKGPVGRSTRRESQVTADAPVRRPEPNVPPSTPRISQR